MGTPDRPSQRREVKASVVEPRRPLPEPAAPKSAGSLWWALGDWRIRTEDEEFAMA